MKFFLALPLLALGSSAFAVELVTNGDFEATPPSSGWTETSLLEGSFIADWSEDTEGAVLTNSAFMGGYDEAVDQLSQTVTAPEGTVGGTLAFDLTRLTIDETGWDFLTISLDGTILDEIDLGDDEETDFFFSRPSYVLPATFGAGSHTLLFEVTTDDFPDFASIAFLDNISLDANVSAVPEPATMAALGLGALALMRRRRSR